MDRYLREIYHEFQTPFQNSVLVFSLILLIILLAPVLLKRLRIPGIIGLIISGAIVGPHGFNLIEQNAAVKLFSTIGLLYIMFIAGLELDMGEFRKTRGKSVVFGLLTFTLPISIGFPVCFYVLDYSFQASLLTASMFATHTLIAYPIVSKLGITKNEAVAVAVGGTILTDSAVLVLLAFISGSAAGESIQQLSLRLGASLLLFLLVVFLLIPRIATWFFKRLEDEKHAHFIFVLSVVFLCAFLAELSGLEPIIGAFVAGLTLNSLIPHTSSLMNRLEFVGNSLFIPFFLVSVGMLVDVSVLGHGSTALIVAASLTTTALIGKWLAAQSTAFIFKYSRAQGRLIFGLSSAHAAATLAVILVGFNAGIIDENILNGTIALILVTCLVASFATEHAGKELVLQLDSDGVDLHTGMVQQILVPIANPQTMERLTDFAISIKEPRNRLPIIGLTIVEDDAQAQGKIVQARKMLDKAIAHATAADQRIEIRATIDNNVTNGITRVARESFATNIVMGWSARTNLADRLFGKAFDSVVHQTYQTVYITRFTLPLSLHKAMHLLCVPLADKEFGFHSWIHEVLRAAVHMRLKTIAYATRETIGEITAHIKRFRITADIDFQECHDAKDFVDLAGSFHPNDIVVLASARRGTISYTTQLDDLPAKLIRALDANSIIVVYPEIESAESPTSFTRDEGSSLLQKSLDILRGTRSKFRKG